MNNKNGFTLIEVIIVIVILAIVAVVAAPKYINLSTLAKIEVIEQIKVSVKSANDLLFVKSKVPSYSVVVSNGGRFTDIDMDGDGDFQINQNDPNAPDVRLIWSYLDNADLIKRINFSGDFVEERDDPNFTYIGYDNNNDGNVQDNNCYFKYTQALTNGGQPVYELQTDGC